MNQQIAIDSILVWDPCRLKEIDEAKKKFSQYKRQGHVITKENGAIMERFEPAAGQAIVLAKKVLNSVMKILNETGDERITWTKENGKQAIKAKEQFEKLLGKGYKAFSVDSKGNKKTQITEFDVDAEEIIMIPPTAKG